MRVRQMPVAGHGQEELCQTVMLDRFDRQSRAQFIVHDDRENDRQPGILAPRRQVPYFGELSMPTLTFPHWRDVPEKAWRRPGFSPSEIACRGTGAVKINTEAMDKLQALRDRLGKPLIVRSAYRSPEHNRAVGGAPASKHMQGTAFDFAMANHDPVAFEAAAREVGFLGFGTYPRSGFMHIDLGPGRS